MGRKRRNKKGGKKGKMHVISPGGGKVSAVALAVAKSVKYRPYRTAQPDLEGKDLSGIISNTTARLSSGRLSASEYPPWARALERETRHKLLAVFAINQTGHTLKRFSGTKTRLYHGTPVNNIALIACNSLRPSTGGLFGMGVYLTPNLGKAMGYASGEMEIDGSLRYVRTVLACDVKLGKVLTANSHDAGTSACSAGYNTILGKPGGLSGAWGGCLRWSEYCVKSAARVSVTHILVFG